MRRIVLVLVFGALVASACGGGTDEGNGSGEPAGDGEDVVAIVPAAGGFGGRLQSAAEFSVVLFVLEDQAEAIDAVGLACAPGGTFTSSVVTIGEAVPLAEGSFVAESPDVRIEGAFVSPTRAEGTITALTQNAIDCGIGESATWAADCDMSLERVVPDPTEGGIVIGGVTVTVESGTAFGMLEIVAENGDRLEGELDDAACAAA